MQWLFPIAVALHNSEQAVWMPGWASQHHICLPSAPPGAGKLRFALVVVTVAAFAVTHLSKRHGKQSFWTYILLGYVVAMLVNVFVPHVPATLLYRTYTPGVITAVFVNLPVMSLLAFVAVRENWVSGERVLVSAIVVPVAIGGTIQILFWMASFFDHRRGFTERATILLDSSRVSEADRAMPHGGPVAEVRQPRFCWSSLREHSMRHIPGFGIVPRNGM